MPGEQCISVENLDKVFHGRDKDRNVNALDGMTFEVERGEFLTIIGPSGCGKTTLLYIIAGLEKATSGTVRIEGNRVESTRKDVGLVFQDVDRTLFPWLTVLGNVKFGLELSRRNSPPIPEEKKEETAMKHIQLVGLEGFENSYIYQLSGGMRQRVAIARVLAYEPRILLMDEPFANLDAQNRLILQGDLVRIWRMTEKTIVFVTHDLEEAISLGTRTIVMTARPGRLKKILNVNFGYPRDYEIRASPEFNELRFSLLQLIQEEVARSG